MTAQTRSIHRIGAAALLLVLGVSFPGCVAGAQVLETVARVDGRPGSQVSVAAFSLTESGTVTVEAVGAHMDGKPLTECWILRADTREVAWQLDRESCSDAGRFAFRCEVDVPLPAGDYEIYYSTVKGKYIAIHTDSRMIGGFLEGFLGDKVLVKGKDFEQEALSDQWGARVLAPAASVAGAAPSAAPDRGRRPGELVAIRRVTGKRLERRAFQLKQPAEVEVYAIGEGSRVAGHKGKMYDYGWIVRSLDRSRVWEMIYGETEHAGGAEKNRMARKRLELPAGRYEVWYVTDDSHNWDEWNQPPPRDPDYWGISVRLAGEMQDPGGIAAADLPVMEGRRIIAAIQRPGDDTFRSRSMLLRRGGHVWIYGIGESSSGRLWDWGWIRDCRDGRILWEMTEAESRWAGGAGKNRVCETVLDLPAGEYLLSYATDDSHSAGSGWNAAPPWDSENAGITAVWLDDVTDGPDYLGFDPARSTRVLAHIGGVGDNAAETVEFTLHSPARVLVVCQGEGSAAGMYDYGWLEKADSGQRVWTMDVQSSTHAGGARKNRQFRGTLDLGPGTYRVHYVSDDSHSFNHWNDTPPDHLGANWGITLFRND